MKKKCSNSSRLFFSWKYVPLKYFKQVSEHLEKNENNENLKQLSKKTHCSSFLSQDDINALLGVATYKKIEILSQREIDILIEAYRKGEK